MIIVGAFFLFGCVSKNPNLPYKIQKQNAKEAWKSLDKE
jgi:PBP1b-binding outer membrane lipoprotein LpoB